MTCFTLITGQAFSSSGAPEDGPVPSTSPSGMRLALPRDLAISKVPVIIEPAYRTLVPQNYGPLGRMMEEADEIFFACDPDPRGVFMFAQHVRRRFGTDEGFRAIRMADTSAEHLEAEFRAGRSTSDVWFRTLLGVAEAKRFFDANWAANALPLFGKLLRDIGAPEPGTFVSKFVLQTMFALRDMEDNLGHVSEQNVIRSMIGWRGTGKHAPAPLGSATSRDAILRTIERLGFLTDMSEGKAARITPSGREFLRRLHPDCEDPDLPARIETWERDWPASRPKMERYIRTFFGKQKTFMARLPSPA